MTKPKNRASASGCRRAKAPGSYHVRARFPQPIPGPLAIGAGRCRGFGIFTADEHEPASSE